MKPYENRNGEPFCSAYIRQFNKMTAGKSWQRERAGGEKEWEGKSSWRERAGGEKE